jgi:pyruvate dehydrogenase E2 component (dihydrolipoamide acetyltransferase)
MPTIVKMPKWGLTMTVGTVTDWLRGEGEEVAAGDPLLTVETEKAVNDVEAPADGVLRKIVASTGSEVPVSNPVAIILSANEALSDEEVDALVASLTPQPNGVEAGTEQDARAARAGRKATRDQSGRVSASPAARKLAQQLGIDLADIDATGPNGRITSDDVERAAASQAADPTPREEAVSLPSGLNLHTLVAGPGQGQKLLFLHGLGGSQSTWQVVLGDLVDRYRVGAFDLPGHGQSDKPAPADFDYSVPALASSIAEGMQALNLAPAIIVGHSLGGAVALHLALERPELVQGLVLINSAGLGAEISEDLLDLMDQEAGKKTARDLLSLFYEDKRWILDRGVEEMAQTQLASGAWEAQQAAATSSFDRSGQRIGLNDRLSEVRQPTLIVWGGKDRVIPVAHAFAAASALPDALLKVVPASGHVPQVEAAPVLARAIDRFARSLAG